MVWYGSIEFVAAYVVYIMSFLYGTTSINHSPDLSIGLITGWDGKHIHHNVVNAPKKVPQRSIIGFIIFWGLSH
jgi:hypothetical protein